LQIQSRYQVIYRGNGSFDYYETTAKEKNIVTTTTLSKPSMLSPPRNLSRCEGAITTALASSAGTRTGNLHAVLLYSKNSLDGSTRCHQLRRLLAESRTADRPADSFSGALPPKVSFFFIVSFDQRN
jgi:hypothetical protein